MSETLCGYAHIVSVSSAAVAAELSLPLSAAGLKAAHGFDHARLLLGGDAGEERQPDQAIADVFRDRALPGVAAEALAHHRGVERHVVERGGDLLRLEVRDQ